MKALRIKTIIIILTMLPFVACGGPDLSSLAPQIPQGPPDASVDSLANICTEDAEKTWVRAHLNDAYLWYNEIENGFPSNYKTAQEYFYALLVRSKDSFSFTAPQSIIDGYRDNGTVVGYGIRFNDYFKVTYVEPNSPAVSQLARGVNIVKINGISRHDLKQSEIAAALYPASEGVTVTLTVSDSSFYSESDLRDVTLTSLAVALTPVPIADIITIVENKKVGYLLFNEHVGTAEKPLIDAISKFQESGIDDLILDLRYNGGGSSYIADELASMIGGSAVKGKTFMNVLFNDKYAEHNFALPFFATDTTQQPLPQLNLPRVFVITSQETCSASEAIINSLKPFMKVITVGEATCGKPYGMIQTNNCDWAYFPVSFSVTNDAGEGDYEYGIESTCFEMDDIDHALGDVAEEVLLKALRFIGSGDCYGTYKTSKSLEYKKMPVRIKNHFRPPWHENGML